MIGENTGMNILVLGNGFDLAHGLPTKYTDFLDWLKDISEIKERIDWEDEIPTSINDFGDWKNKREDIWTVKFDDSFLSLYWRVKDDENFQRRIIQHTKIKEWLIEHDNSFDFKQEMSSINSSITKFVKEDRENKKIKLKNFSDVILKVSQKDKAFAFYNNERIDQTKKYIKNDVALRIFFLMHNNFWVMYFFDKSKFPEDNWIDFEKEISNIIIELNENKERIVSEYKNYFSKSTYTQSRKVIKVLDYDLNRFILLLEIYLCVYVQTVNYTKLSKDIKDLKIEKIISFNYTNTYEKIYDNDKNAEYDYIHGKADINNTIESNNMVLGIDEYLPEDRKNKDVEFIAFKKYYQRIHKQTGCKYKEWVEKIKESWQVWDESIKRKSMRYISKGCIDDEINLRDLHTIKNITHNLYIFGHSLDVTDRDILRDLILHDNVHTTIFYLNKEVMGQQIANLVKVIGQDELIKRTGGSTKTIEFKQQQDMGEKKDSKSNNT